MITTHLKPATLLFLLLTSLQGSRMGPAAAAAAGPPGVDPRTLSTLARDLHLLHQHLACDGLSGGVSGMEMTSSILRGGVNGRTVGVTPPGRRLGLLEMARMGIFQERDLVLCIEDFGGDETDPDYPGLLRSLLQSQNQNAVRKTWVIGR